MIYFVQRPSDRAIKIGTTIRLSTRLWQLRRGFPDCQVLAVMDGGQPEEHALHSRFKACRIRGEWFSPTAGLLECIQTEARPWDGNDDVPKPMAIYVSEDFHQMLRVVSAISDRRMDHILEELAREPLRALYDRLIAENFERPSKELASAG